MHQIQDRQVEDRKVEDRKVEDRQVEGLVIRPVSVVKEATNKLFILY